MARARMAMAKFSQIDQRAATITGGILGFIWWLFRTPYGMFGGTGATGVMGAMMSYLYVNAGVFAGLLGIAVGAIAGAILASIYNWALTLK